ncbi:Putative nuclease HARBI1 [Eumeta japonica]|uniref:Nuclease HARBI1 n=1 Tax=Eumeta variegata TaxID=151549 RepID=A0A4C1TG82_EUMVA|nr:Putative nuclease HARBI1 [Eumeta japonica]
MTTYIKFPESIEEQSEAMRHFKEIANMPLIIGAVDCTHIRIKKTGAHLAQTYIKRKGYYSLNVQAISDAHCKLTNIVAKWRGSTHDSRIFQQSQIGQRFDNSEFIGKLVADSGYRSTSYMLMPVANSTTYSQIRYNKAQMTTRNVVERLFGQWKQRFRGLLRGLSQSINTVKIIIVAMAVLHNISLDVRAEQTDWSDYEDSENEDTIQTPDTTISQNNLHRDAFIRLYF